MVSNASRLSTPPKSSGRLWTRPKLTTSAGVAGPTVRNGPSRASRAAKLSSRACPVAADGRQGHPGRQQALRAGDGQRGASAEGQRVVQGREDRGTHDLQQVRPEIFQRHAHHLAEVPPGGRHRPLAEHYLTRSAWQAALGEHWHERAIVPRQ